MPDKPKADQDQPNPGDDTPNAVAPLKSEPQKPNAGTTTQPGADQTKPISSFDKEMLNWTAMVGRWTRIVGWVTGFSVLAAGVGIVATIWIGNKADETARAAQRPWMKFSDMALLDPIHCEPDVIKTRVRLFLEDSGNSPALHVEGNAFLSIDPGTLTSDKKIHALCDPIRLAEPNTGFASFPNSKPVTLDIDVSARRMGIGLPMPIIPTIIACITYRFPFGEGEGHQTGMMVNFGGPKHSGDLGNDLGGLAVNCPAGTDLKPEALDRTISPLGSYAN